MEVRREDSIRKGIDEMINLGRHRHIDQECRNRDANREPQLPLAADALLGGLLRDLIDTDLTGPFLVAKAVVSHLLRAAHGPRIINIISMNQETMVGFMRDEAVDSLLPLIIHHLSSAFDHTSSLFCL